MTNTGDIDPAEAIRQQRAAEEAEKQRAQAEQNLYRTNILKLLRYADEQLQEISNPVVSEFVVTEKWWTQDTEQISVKSSPNDFKNRLAKNQRIINTTCERKQGFFVSPKYTYTVATYHQRDRQTHYYGSWLSLINTSSARSEDNKIEGLVKLRQPRAGYADVKIRNDSDPRNVGHIGIQWTDSLGLEQYRTNGDFQISASLEEAAGHEYFRSPPDIEYLTKRVKQALDFVETGQPPEPEKTRYDNPYN